jgi:hypothetical protein
MDKVNLNAAPRAARPPTTVGPAKPPPNGAGPGFAVEAVSLRISLDVTLLQSIGGGQGPGRGQGPSPDEVRAQVREYVKGVFERNGIELEEMSAEEAGQAVGPGGEWSPENVAKRIVDFVKGFADGTEKREGLLRDAVEQGLREAEAAWGKELPEIAYQTMALVRTGLDELFGAAGDQSPAAGSAAARRDSQA